MTTTSYNLHTGTKPLQHLQGYAAPAKGDDYIKDLSTPGLVVRINANGARRFEFHARVPYTTKSGKPSDKLAKCGLGDVGTLSIAHAQNLARRAAEIFNSEGRDADAMDAVRAQLANDHQGDVKVVIREKSAETVARAFADYFAYHSETGPGKTWRPETVRTKSHNVKARILAHVGDTPLEDLTDPVVQWLLDLCPTESAQDMTVKTLNAFRNWAEFLDRPVAFKQVRNKKAKGNSVPRATRAARTLAETRAMGRYCWAVINDPTSHVSDRTSAQIHLFLMYSVLRIGTLPRLLQSDIVRGIGKDPDYIHVPAHANKVDTSDKNNVDHTVLITPGLRRVLDTFAPRADGRFVSRSYKNIPRPSRERFTADLGFGFDQHSWRYTFSTCVGGLRLDRSRCEMILGHSLAKILGSATARTYAKTPAHEEADKEMAIWSDFLDYVIHTDADLGEGARVSKSVRKAFKKWRKGRKAKLRAVQHAA